VEQGDGFREGPYPSYALRSDIAALSVARPVHRMALGGNVVDIGDPGITAI
jgi:hypothetical protein